MARFVTILLALVVSSSNVTVAVAFPQDPFGAPQAAVAPGTPPPGAPAGPNGPGGPNPSGEAKPGDAKPADGAKPADAAPSPPKVIRRDEMESEPANATELKKAVLGEDGKVAFEFRNQTWPELIQWLSAISGEPLDWQELPGDKVNITTPGRYTVDEVRDLLNRHLLGRGYTLLALDGGLTVVKCDTVNPSLVPRFDETALAKISPHSFVRVSLDVGWLSAEKLATELKPMMSKNGVLSALTTTNRLEAMDSAITLRHVAQLLSQERDAASREALAPEFKLRWLPAEEAKRMLEEFLGIAKKKETPPTPQEMQMMQQMRQQNGGQPAPPEEKKPAVSVVANNRQNSIIIMAPPDRIAIATEFLKRIDVPSSSISSLADVEDRVQVFRLASLDPEKLIEIIQEMNILEPTTRTRTDNENRAVIVSGSAADRYIIDQLIKRLDGSGRQFEVLQLRRLDAGEVAESIAFLMGEEKTEDKSNSRRNSYFWGGEPEKEKKKEDKFRVAANTRFRQVLLWANELEMAEVRNLLIKLGELPPPGGDSRTVRIIDASPTPETLEYLKRLKEQWSQMAPNVIELPNPEAFVDPAAAADDPAVDEADDQSPDGVKAIPAVPQEKQEKPKKGGSGRDSVTMHSTGAEYRFAMLQSAAEPVELAEPLEDLPSIKNVDDFDRAFGNQKQQQKTEKKPAYPIRIEVDGAGNLMLSSSDTEALDRLEALMLQIAPPKRPYRVFKIQNASASWMRLNLEDYFKDEDDKKSNNNDSFFRWIYDIDDESKKKEPAGLGKGNKLRFIDDIDTNTIVVNNADAEQLKTIEELIELWDVTEPANKRKTRFTKLLTIEFGKADKIASTVKDAYRDLLSGNDKAFQQQAPQGEAGGTSSSRNRSSRNRDGNGSDLIDTAGDRASGGSDFTFKGKLSIGIDDVGNTLLISAEGEPLLNLVCDMVKQLDEASRPSGDVQVVKLSGGVSAQSLEAALRAFGASGSGPKGASSADKRQKGAEAEESTPAP